jgi:hypothetical protein
MVDVRLPVAGDSPVMQEPNPGAGQVLCQAGRGAHLAPSALSPDLGRGRLVDHARERDAEAAEL